MLATRMQWMEYKHKFNLRKSIADMVKNDGMAMFYRGLIPTLNAQIFVFIAIETSRKLAFEFKMKGTEYFWPLLVSVGLLYAHPQTILAQKVYCGRYTHPRIQHVYTNSLKILLEIYKKGGPKSLYVGFGPSIFVYLISYSSEIKSLMSFSSEKIFGSKK